MTPDAADPQSLKDQRVFLTGWMTKWITAAMH
jgi:hypothetical protein